MSDKEEDLVDSLLGDPGDLLIRFLLIESGKYVVKKIRAWWKKRKADPPDDDTS